MKYGEIRGINVRGCIQYNGFGVIFPRESSEPSDFSEMRLKTFFGTDLGQ